MIIIVRNDTFLITLNVRQRFAAGDNILVTISLNMYGISPPKAATVLLWPEATTFLNPREPIRGRRPPQLLVAEGHKDL